MVDFQKIPKSGPIWLRFTTSALALMGHKKQGTTLKFPLYQLPQRELVVPGAQAECESRGAVTSKGRLSCATPQRLQYQYNHIFSELGGTPLQLAKSWKRSLVLSANQKFEASPLLTGNNRKFDLTEFAKERNSTKKKSIQIFDSLET